ncbi:MAG: hypothetical protein GX610_07510 [Rhodococcus sp.]|nr:hypothetical protein [Rhodococcus sp. (in: high G+C Gram-positive bacteria)]
MRVLAVALIGLVVAGCSSGADSEPIEPSSERPPAIQQIPSDDFRTAFTPRPDIVRGHETPIESWSEVDPRTIALNFTTGTPECYGVDPVVTETDATIEVSVRTGALPETADKMCVLIAVMGTVEVPLETPIGDRDVVGN